MVTIKSTESQTILKSAGPKTSAFLIYGTDAGHVAELVRDLAKGLSAQSDPPGEIIRLSEQDLSNTPGRLAAEARSLPMFGGPPVILVKQGPQITPALIGELLSDTQLAATILIEAGNLKKDAKLRQIFEKASNAAAIGCYGMDHRGVAQLIRDDIQRAGLTITQDAFHRLTELLGADWAVSRAEVVKLILYAGDDTQITLEHVEAVVGDASAHAFDAAISQTLNGNAPSALGHLDGLVTSGTPASVFLTLLLGHLQKLHLVRAAIDRGESFDTAASKIRPPLHFRQKDAMKAQAKLWSIHGVAAAIEATHETLRQTRLKPGLDHELVSDLVTRLCRPRKSRAA